MNKPFVICHMMMSLDGRIDCKMTENLKGVENYYETLDSFNSCSTISGRITAEKEIALNGKFEIKNINPIKKESFYKVKENKGYQIILDTKGSLLWDNQKNEDIPILVLTSEKVNKDYLDYLESKNISWIAVGKDKINLKKGLEILFNEFNVKKVVIVGGGHINASFLNEGLIDEISVLIGAGIDGRKDMCSIFDGLNLDKEVTQLTLKDVKVFNNDAVWIKYKVK